METMLRDAKMQSDEIAPDLKEQIVLEHNALIRYIVNRIAVRLPSHIDLDDLHNTGVIGLMDAIDKYDPDKNCKFKTYAEFRSCYKDDFAPPRWVLQNSESLLHALGRSAVALYSGEKMAAMRLLFYREPTNIGFDKKYNAGKLKSFFDYRENPYGELSEYTHRKGQLPPQVAVACRTPILNVQYADNAKLPESPTVVNVVSIIGLAFDDPKQPDYQYFYDGGTLKRDKLKEAMIKAYVLAFAATHAMGKRTLVPSPG